MMVFEVSVKTRVFIPGPPILMLVGFVLYVTSNELRP